MLAKKIKNINLKQFKIVPFKQISHLKIFYQVFIFQGLEKITMKRK